MACLLLGVATFGLLQSFVTPILPIIQSDLHTSQSTVTWVMTAYLLSASVCTPIVGRLGDSVGKNRAFVLALLALALGCLVAALAQSIEVMIAARALQGVGGGLLPLTFGIIRDELPPARVPGAVGTAAALVAAGSGVGLALAGPLSDAFGYRSLFWIPLTMVIASAAAAHLLLPESPRYPVGRPNPLAALALSAALIAFLLSISEGPREGWTSQRVLGGLVLAVVCGAAWILTELRSRNPLVDLRVMALPAVWTTNSVAFLFGAVMFASMTFLPQYLQTPRSSGYGLGSSVTQCGLYLLPQAATLIALGLAAGRLSRRFGPRGVLQLGCALTVVPFAIMGTTPRSPWLIVVTSILFGIGPGLGFSAMATLVVQAVPAGRAGVAAGMNANIRTMGGAVGAGVMASIVAVHVAGAGYPSRAQYREGFLFLTAVAVLALVAARLVPRPASLSSAGIIEHAEVAIIPAAPLGQATAS